MMTFLVAFLSESNQKQTVLQRHMGDVSCFCLCDWFVKIFTYVFEHEILLCNFMHVFIFDSYRSDE